MPKYTCMDCEYQSARMNCLENLKNDCTGCPMHGDEPHSCKCTEHQLIGEDCPDFKLLEDHHD